MSDIKITVEDRAGRRCASSGSKWEPLMGYSRAVRVGDAVHVSGCVGILPDGTYPPTMAAQTQRCLERIGDALAMFNLTLESIVRVRLFTTRVEQWQEIASVMGPAFARARPACALLGVAALIDSAALIEIEADAVDTRAVSSRR